MAIYRIQAAFPMDSLLARDCLCINPVFNKTTGVLTDTDADSLCEDLAIALDTWSLGTQRIECKAYEVESPPPNLPAGSHVVNPTAAPGSAEPREVALCLSFYSDFNLARRRGRLYIPATLLTGDASVRPSSAMMQKVADLVPILSDLGGLDIDWSVYSAVDSEARAVTHWWVDDEWDTIRSRGMGSTTRLAGTTAP